MTAFRLLHIDDEADIREIVEISLGLDPAFTIRSCESGAEGLAAAAEWNPDVILLDVMMPVMDGPATLAGLLDNPATADVPVIFMTARAQARELDRFRTLGAIGVIAKPFDPMTLAASVRSYLPQSPDPLEKLRAGFAQRVRRDIAALSEHCATLKDGTPPPPTLESIRHIAHSLSGAGGIYGFPEISTAAAAIEDAALAGLAGTLSARDLSAALNNLVAGATSAGKPAGHAGAGSPR
jgi:two-component system OmpR family response regulator